jgi:hypothetical protein
VNTTTPTEAIEQAFQSAMTDPGSPFDSHPPPGRRIEWVQRLEGTPVLSDSKEEALRLLPDKEKLEGDMTKQVSEQVAGYLAYQQALAQEMMEGDDDEITTLGSLTR